MISQRHDELVIGKDVLREHQDLEALLVSIVGYVHAASTATPAVVQRVVDDLRRFRGLLARHFELEEKGGLFRVLRRRLPSESRLVDALKGEHQEFLDDLDELLQGVERTDFADLESLRRDLACFLSTYEEHEQAENRLLQQAYNEDLGAPD